MGYLFETKRHRLVLPHRLMGALVPLLDELLSLLDAVGAHVEDDRWTEAAVRIRAAVEELRRPSDLLERIWRVEQREREQEVRAAVERELAEAERIAALPENRRKVAEQNKHELVELHRVRDRLLARRARLDKDVGRIPDRGSPARPPRKGVLFVREVAARLLRR